VTAPAASSGCSLEDILETIEPPGAADAGDFSLAEGLLSLAKTLSAEPGAVARHLVETAMRLTGAESAGISLLDPPSGDHFNWVATAGDFARYLHGTMPRHFSPCGTVFDKGHALMMRDAVRYYPYIGDLHLPVRVVLLVPFSQDGVLIGTLWVIRHACDTAFTQQDLSAVTALADFAAMLFQNAATLTTLRSQEEEGRQRLAQSESARRLLDGFFRQAPGFIALLRGEDHVVELANESFLRLVGKRDLVGRPIFDAVPEIRGQGFEALLRTVYTSGMPHVGRGVKLAVLDEHHQPVTRYVDFVYQPLLEDGEARVSGIFVQGHDVTEQHLAVARLEEADANKEKFLALLSHELRNPMSGIRLAAMLLKITTGKDDPRQQRALRTLENQTAVLSRLVDDMVDASSIRSGKFRLQPDDLVLQDVIAAVLEATQPFIAQRGHVLDVQVVEAPLSIRGDATRLEQVFINLLSNAAKYSPEGSSILLRARAVERHAVVEVQDSGIGIAEDFLPQLFEMYAQAPSSKGLGQGGLGLGLSLARQLIELHGGRITAHSEGLGCGACFTVTLPLSGG
jgi:signal transduction histidine kinase